MTRGKSTAARAPRDGLDIDKVTQRVVPASSVRHPTTWQRPANSAFDAGAAAKKAARKPREIVDLDVDAIEIRSGVPKPERGKGGDKYRRILERMAVGDSVELAPNAAKAFYAAAKKYAERVNAQPRDSGAGSRVAFSYRKTGPTTAGIWRDS